MREELPAGDTKFPWAKRRVLPLKILLAEDDEANRKFFRAHFKRASDQLDMAEKGDAAVERFKENKYDLVLMSVQLPVIDGCTAAGMIRKWENENDRLPVSIIALTSHSSSEDKRI